MIDNSRLEMIISTVKSNRRMILRDDPVGSYWDKDDDGKRVLVRTHADGDNYWGITTEELALIEQEILKANTSAQDRVKNLQTYKLSEGSTELLVMREDVLAELNQLLNGGEIV